MKSNRIATNRQIVLYDQLDEFQKKIKNKENNNKSSRGTLDIDVQPWRRLHTQLDVCPHRTKMSNQQSPRHWERV